MTGDRVGVLNENLVADDTVACCQVRRRALDGCHQLLPVIQKRKLCAAAAAACATMVVRIPNCAATRGATQPPKAIASSEYLEEDLEAIAVASQARSLVNMSHQDLATVRRHAWSVVCQQEEAVIAKQSIAELKSGSASLGRIAQQLAKLPHRMPQHVHLLALFPVCNVPAVHRMLQDAMNAIRPSDFSVFHHDAMGTSSGHFRAFARHAWYSRSSQIVHRSFRTNGSSCINVGWISAMSYIVAGAGSQSGYTHLWKFDADLHFGLFSFQAFRALLAFGAPFLAQPAILPKAKGLRSTDRNGLQALYMSTQRTRSVGPTYAVAGRERLQGRACIKDVDKPLDPRRTPYKGRVRFLDDIETMCPCIDAILLRALLAAIQLLDPANEIGLSEIMNRIAMAAADASRAAGSPRPAGLVLDYTPLVHMDTRLRNWMNGTYTEVKANLSCPRSRVRPEMPPGAWRHLMPSSWPRIRAGFLDVSANHTFSHISFHARASVLRKLPTHAFGSETKMHADTALSSPPVTSYPSSRVSRG